MLEHLIFLKKTLSTAMLINLERWWNI